MCVAAEFTCCHNQPAIRATCECRNGMLDLICDCADGDRADLYPMRGRSGRLDDAARILAN